MKPHHRASLLVGCLGLFLLYLPDGLQVAGGWPSRPVLGSVPDPQGASFADLVARPIELVPLPSPLPSPQGPPAPMTLDELGLEQARASYSGGQ